MACTLKVNDSGSWRNLVRFDRVRLAEVKAAVQPLADVMGEGTKWQIDDEGKPLFLKGQRWLTLQQIQARAGSV